MPTFNNQYRTIYLVLGIALVFCFLFSIRYGAIVISYSDIISSIQKSFSSEDTLTLTERIFFNIRLPRAIACLLVGGSLAMAGVLMQALFRNPIVEPGLIGTSSGAAFGASLYFVLGAIFKFQAGEWTLPLAAALGGALATILVFFLSFQKSALRRQSIVTLLLTGIAINALFLSGVGLMSYLARDPQARSITFWNLGTLSGANWTAVIILSVMCLGCFFVAMKKVKSLNALILGEEEAVNIGVDIKRLQWTILLINVLLVATATAFVGVISFVGLIVPHLLRLIKGSDNRYLLIGSLMMGGILLTIADLATRLLLAPAELPIGIVTAVVGVPVFIFLLRKNQYLF